MKERKEGRKEEGRGKRREKEKTPATGVLTLSSLPPSLSSHLWLPGFQPRCFTSFDDANVTRHHHYQPTITTVSLSPLSLSLYTGTRCKNPSPLHRAFSRACTAFHAVQSPCKDLRMCFTRSGQRPVPGGKKGPREGKKEW